MHHEHWWPFTDTSVVHLTAVDIDEVPRYPVCHFILSRRVVSIDVMR